LIPFGLQLDALCIMEPMTANTDTAHRAARTGISSTSGNDYVKDFELILRSSGANDYALVALPPQRPVTLREIADLQALHYDESETEPDAVAIARASSFASKASARNLPNPTVLPLPEGGVMLRYRSGALFVSVEAFNDGEFLVALSGAGVPTEIETPDSDDVALAMVLAHLR